MRWPWRRGRRAEGRVVFIGTSPFDVQKVIATVPTPSPVVAAFVPESPADEAPQVSSFGVQLGFADGTVVMLADDDPRAVALLAAANRLTGTS